MSRPEPATSRKRRIPGTLVLNWQSTETATSKPLIRRPMTACEACRAAKVKCNGKRECERCKNRSIQCTYLNPSTDDTAVEAAVAPSLHTTSDATSPHIIQTPEQTSIDTPSSSDPFSINDTIQDLASRTLEWPDEAFNHALEQFDWVFPDMNFDDHTQPLESHGQNQDDIDLFQPLTEATPLPTSEDQDQSPAVLSDTLGLPQNQLVPSECQCRAKLMSHIPGLESAMQEKPQPRLDRMFQVTGDVIRSCHATISCESCQVGSVDLVCTLTVFQQTAACFNAIAKSGLDGNIKVGIGDYEVSLVDDTTFKRMLVLDLVKQANAFLDLLDTHAHGLFLAQHPSSRKVMNRSPACLNQLNLDYVREIITNFKKLFRLMSNVFDGREVDSH